MILSLSDIKNILNCEIVGDYNPSATISEFIFDSRSLAISASTCFCAVRTKIADGHRYIPSLYEKGVRCFLVEALPDNPATMTDAAFFVVDDVIAAVEKISANFRENFKGTVIGITGSAGKTVVKEMIYSAMVSLDIPASRSPRSWNSRIGVPFSILEAAPDDRFIIIEVGIDSLGDMEHHARLIKPDIGILCSITHEHDAGFPSFEKKIEEKIKLFKGCKTLIYDASNPSVDAIIRAKLPSAVLIPVTGSDHTSVNSALAAAALSQIGVDAKNITFETVTNRINVHQGVNGCVMFYDGFTNDIRSLRSTLDFIRRRSDNNLKLTVVLSDLLHPHLQSDELKALYDYLSLLLEAYGVNRLIAIGPELKKFRHLIPDNIEVETVRSAADFLSEYDITRFSHENILIFGAPSVDFQEIKKMLESPRHDTIMEINLDALAHNFRAFRSLLRPSTGVVAMIKASAYGSGAPEIAKTLSDAGAAYLAVAVIAEGIELRKSGISLPVMVLNPVTTNYRALFHHNLEPSVFSLREFDILVDEARKAGVKNLNIHLKIDSGMHRVGFTYDELPKLIEKIRQNPAVTVKSIFSHLATADCPDQAEYTVGQIENFKKAAATINETLPSPAALHILNTAGIIDFNHAQFDMVRLGIGLYGVSPFDGDKLGLRNVASLKSTIISLRRWDEGTTIGYGRKGILTRPSLIATLPVGYADGLDRHLSCGNAAFMVRGVLCPTVGNICMDQCMIDVTDVPDAAIGDEVEIFGNNIPVKNLADTLGTIPYEILTSVSPRVKRIYFRD